MPAHEDLRDEAIRILRSVGLDVGAAEASRVGAANALIKVTEKPQWSAGLGEGEAPRALSLEDRLTQ